MGAVARRIFLLAVTALSLTACASEPLKQWYKPGGNYTMAEFQRDEAACTQNKVLDEECLKARGWTALSADRDKGPAPMQGGPGTAKPRFAY